MNVPILPDRVRFWMYLIGFALWALVMGAGAYFDALSQTPPDFVIGSTGVVDWLVGAGLLVATTHTSRTTPGRHVDADSDGVADAAQG